MAPPGNIRGRNPVPVSGIISMRFKLSKFVDPKLTYFRMQNVVFLVVPGTNAWARGSFL
jgi:hypothetical protein